MKNIVELIPFPLNEIYGYEHLRLKELHSAAIFTFAILYFQENLQKKLKYLYSIV